MTKISIFKSENSSCKKQSKQIELVKKCAHELWEATAQTASEQEEIVLLEKTYTGRLDLMWCKNSSGIWVLYLGHWNDGVV